MSTPKKRKEHIESVIGAFMSLWFPATIKDHQSCEKGFDLAPHAAVCLALMTTKSIACSESIAVELGPVRLKMLDKREANIMVEYGLDALSKAGYVKLDAQGKKEFALARETRTYGHGGVHWTLTSAGARRAAPFYCSYIGKTSDYQKQAVQDLLMANKKSIQLGRLIEREAEELAKAPKKTRTKVGKTLAKKPKKSVK